MVFRDVGHDRFRIYISDRPPHYADTAQTGYGIGQKG